MCFSATASFTAAAVLVPAGALTARRAYTADRRYLAIGVLPLLFGLQQFSEGMVWTGGARQAPGLVAAFSLAYMFFAWFLWPVWVPFATFFVEPARRKPLYLLFAIAGATLGGLQYVPYFAHDGWLATTFLNRAIAYGGTELLDLVIGRNATYTIYLAIIIAPLLIASDRRLRVFGVLVSLVFVTTYLFFRFAYISVFCFGGALMSLYLVYVIFRLKPWRPAGDLAAT
jgi:hypothetical protein